MVGLAQLVHLLLILPATASDLAWAALDELDVVLPQLTRVTVNANRSNHKVVGHAQDSARLPVGVVVQIVSSADVVEVYGPKLDIGHIDQ